MKKGISGKTALSIALTVMVFSTLMATAIPAPATASAEILYEFTNCGQTGPYGPSQAQCDSAYAGTPLEGQVTVNNGIQFWTVPKTGTYTIEAFGAKGGSGRWWWWQPDGGFGARMKGDFYLTAGTTLKILVGQMGTSAPSYYSWGGGGGTFVVKNDDIPLIIAGGGGAGFAHYIEGWKWGGPGRTEESGGPDGNGGQNGNGGQAEPYGYGGGGGGFYTDGAGNGGKAFLNGGYGSTALNNGGFGGGGGTSNNGYNIGGGGGGYSGGNAGAFIDYSSGGGGSYNSGSNQDNTAGANNGHGKVIISRAPLPRSIEKSLSLSDGELGDSVRVTLNVGVPAGETATVVDTLPPEWKYITGTFKVNSASATPTVTVTPPPPPRSEVISYAITASGTYTIEFDAKVTEAYWEERTVTNKATATWCDELGGIVDQMEAKADFVIHAFKQLHKSVGIPKKVKVIPAPVQFWRQFIGGVTDMIVSDPPEWPEGAALVRDYAVLHEPMEAVSLKLLTWEGTQNLRWMEIDKDKDGDGIRDPYILMPGQVAEYDIYTDELTTAVLVRYTVAWASTPDVTEAHFINEAILESKSPQVIVGQLSNFDVHNDYHEPVDNFELELYGIQPSDIVDWFPGWGTPPQINPIKGGTEITWMDSAHPVQPCQWVHFGLHLKPGVIATGIKAYWTQMETTLTIKEKTNVQWTLVFEVTNPFPYTMTNVVITDRFGAELEIDPPFPYSITHGAASYYTQGASAKVFLTWNVGNLKPGETARLKILVSTDTNPGRGDCNKDGVVNIYDAAVFIANYGTAYPYADFNRDGYVNVIDAITMMTNWGALTGTGKQEYTEPGVYEMNSGATLKFIDPEQNVQLSAATGSIYVTVLPAEDP